MESIEEDQGFGLNIVCEAIAPKGSHQPKKRVRKLNKYEKRRAKARRAKGLDVAPTSRGLDVAPKRNQSASTVPKEQFGETKGTESASTKDPLTKARNEESIGIESKGGASTEQDSYPDAASNMESPSAPELVGADSTNSGDNHDDKKSAETVAADDAPPPPTTRRTQLDQPQNVDNNTVSTTTTPTRKKHTNTLQDANERAKYMAEFHARPMEMDRRSGAVVSTIQAARDSTHLFDACLFEGVHPRLASALVKMDINRPTVIQSQALKVFQKSNDANVYIQSETGSGKTLAFLLPIMQSLAIDRETGEPKPVDRSVGGTRCIILCPTRELASQTTLVATTLCRHSYSWIVPGCLSGGEKRKSEKSRIRKGISLLIATPGRCLDHLQHTETLCMSLKGKLEFLVLDEADRLLDMGLGGQVEQIVQHVRANQPKSGPKRNGVTWKSVLVSATVTKRVEELGQKMLGGDEWVWARGGSVEQAGLADSTPRQLSQLHVTVNAKLRLATLVAFLAQRVKEKQRTVVFMSTCDGVDYHQALFTSMDSIFTEDDVAGFFGKECPIYKLHGNMRHAERQVVLREFGSKKCALLLATDVAARGLNLKDLDWTVQYDPPCEVADYVHRAGRTARAGKGGHSLLFLLPSERQFLDVLQAKGVKNMSALSLNSTLNQAADLCVDVTKAGTKRSGRGGGEAFCGEIQYRMEGCVMDDDAKARAAAGKARGKKKQVSGELLELARKAFASYIRSYPTKEKSVRHIFSARALHLGHVARSFALKEPPTALVKTRGRVETNPEGGKRKNTSLAFRDGSDTSSKRAKTTKEDADRLTSNNSGRALLHARAARLQDGGMDAF